MASPEDQALLAQTVGADPYQGKTEIEGTDPLVIQPRQSAPTRPAPKLAGAGLSIPGDALFAAAEKYNSLSDDDHAAIELFKTSDQVVRSRLKMDKGFAARVLPELQKLADDPAKLHEKIVDEADNLRIEQMKKDEPDLFNGKMAFASALGNSASFGQFTKLQSAIESGALQLQDLVTGSDTARSYQSLLKENAERARLLQKAFPKTNIVGEVSGFLVPGSPAKIAFEKAAKVGSKIVGSLIGRMATNPGVFGKVAQAAGGSGAGSAAIGGVQGTLGTGDQGFSFDRGAATSLASGTTGVMWGLAFGTLGAAGSRVVRRAPRVVEQTTGTNADALRAYSANPAAIESAALPGAARGAGAKLVEVLESQEASLPEVVKANELLQSFPNVSARRIINHLEQAKKTLSPDDLHLANDLDGWISLIKSKIPSRQGAGPGGLTSAIDIDQMPAAALREVVNILQRTARDQYGMKSGTYLTALKTAGHEGRQTIIDAASDLAMKGKLSGADEAAKRVGEMATTYVGFMEKAAEKREVLEFIANELGTHPKKMNRNAEAFINNLFGANKTLVQAKMRELDQKFQTNFTELAENIKHARQLGPEGKPQVLATQRTGATLLGQNVGAALGGTLGAVSGFALGSLAGGGAGVIGGGAAGRFIGEGVGALASSPQVGMRIIGASDKISKVREVLAESPFLLDRIRADKATPRVVKEAATQIANTLKKDGPISMGSTLRILADTPFFIGLVHAIDVAQSKVSRELPAKAIEAYRQLPK